MNSFTSDNEDNLVLDELTGTGNVNSSESFYKLEDLFIQKNQADPQVFSKYLEIVQTIPLNLIDDDEFLAATDDLNPEEFLEAVWRGYFKREITPKEKSEQVQAIGQYRRAYLTMGIRPLVENSQPAPVEKISIALGTFLGRLKSVLLQKIF